MTDLDLQTSFNEEMHRLNAEAFGDRMAVAVSGGSDSMALALLTRDWAAEHGIEVVALTVDHGLRKSSYDETRQVAEWLSARGIETEILTWMEPYTETGIQAAAREARYALMTSYCRENGIDALLLGHQREDQAETLLMRLSRGSGLDGLAAIRPVSLREGLVLLRPLLKFRRSRLREFLILQHQNWIEDPSNENPKFTRTHAGMVLAALQNLPESDEDAVAMSATRLNRAADALNRITEERFHEICDVSPYGFIQIADQGFRECPEEIGLRLLNRSISLVSGKDSPAKLSAIENLYERCFLQGASRSETLSGCEIFKNGVGWTVCRETGRHDLPEMDVDGSPAFLWDGRYHIFDRNPSASGEKRLKIRRIGSDGWRSLKKAELSREVRNLPAKVRNSLPGIWSGGNLVAVPLFSCELGQSAIAKGRFKMVFRPLVTIEPTGIINDRPIGT